MVNQLPLDESKFESHPDWREIARACEALVAQNPNEASTSSDAWPYIVRPSEWAIGRGVSPPSQIGIHWSKDSGVHSLLQTIEAMAYLLGFYPREDPFVRENGRKPGIIVQPVIASVGPAGWYPEWSGYAFGNRPGKGTYANVAPGLAGGTQRGQHIDPQTDLAEFKISKDLTGDKITRGRSSTGPVRTQPLTVDESTDPTKLSLIWQPIKNVTSQFGGTSYFEWAINANEVWVTQFETLTEARTGQANIPPTAKPILSLSNSIYGFVDVQIDHAWVIPPGAFERYFALAEAERNRPHMVLVSSSDVRRFMEGFDRWPPHNRFSKLKAIIEVSDIRSQPSNNKLSAEFSGHRENNYLADKNVFGVIAHETDISGLPQPVQARLPSLKSYKASSDLELVGADVDWVIVTDQKENQMLIYDISSLGQ